MYDVISSGISQMRNALLSLEAPIIYKTLILSYYRTKGVAYLIIYNVKVKEHFSRTLHLMNVGTIEFIISVNVAIITTAHNGCAFKEP